MQHKWHKEIKAWADGAEIEMYKGLNDDIWDYVAYPNWDNDIFKFRIKPQPKEPQYLYVYRHPQNSSFMFVDHYYKSKDYIGKIKLEVDDVPSDV